MSSLFGWCNTNQHYECSKQFNWNDTIIQCSCNCHKETGPTV